MKLKIIILAAFLTSAALLWGDTVVEYFTAKSNGSSIIIEWKSKDESSILKYELERGTNNSFQKIETFETKGAWAVYQHIDDNAYLRGDGEVDKPQQKTHFQYRLKIIKPSNIYTYSNTVDVVHDISVIKRTWGMIKEMFR
jgi:hypothetical protein